MVSGPGPGNMLSHHEALAPGPGTLTVPTPELRQEGRGFGAWNPWATQALSSEDPRPLLMGEDWLILGITTVDVCVLTLTGT